MKAIREIKDINFTSADTLVIFGEVFKGGYVSGLIRSAKSRGMKVIYSTVGRYEPDGSLRPLNEQELNSHAQAQANQPLINVPLSAGFDMEPSDSGTRPVDLFKKVSLTAWDKFKLDKNVVESSRKNALRSFKERVLKWIEELSEKLSSKGNVLIVHTMAGGVPRAKIFLPVLNRVLKGVGKRFFPSEVFWKSDMGFLCEKNFKEVTAQTYKHLIELSTSLREKLNKSGREVFYTAYSYHGTEVLMGDKYQWQSYSPYLQGFAKLELENISKDFFNKGIKTSVFNVPEILTKSSAVFPGVEIPLYTILGALKKQGGEEGTKIISQCLEKMKGGAFNVIMDKTKNYFESEEVKKQSVFKKWPQHNSAKQMEIMLDTSKKLSLLHKEPAQSITPFLSEILFNSTGNLMLQEMSDTKQALCWLGHDIIADDIRERKIT